MMAFVRTNDLNWRHNWHVTILSCRKNSGLSNEGEKRLKCRNTTKAPRAGFRYRPHPISPLTTNDHIQQSKNARLTIRLRDSIIKHIDNSRSRSCENVHWMYSLGCLTNHMTHYMIPILKRKSLSSSYLRVGINDLKHTNNPRVLFNDIYHCYCKRSRRSTKMKGICFQCNLSKIILSPCEFSCS